MYSLEPPCAPQASSLYVPVAGTTKVFSERMELKLYTVPSSTEAVSIKVILAKPFPSLAQSLLGSEEEHEPKPSEFVLVASSPETLELKAYMCLFFNEELAI